MATNFPTSVDNGTTLPNPTGSNTLNSPDHAAEHANANDAIKAVETKLGTGSSTASSGTVLRGTGSGTTAFAQVVLSTDVAAFSSANLRGVLSDETGSGAAVFATTPTLTTPAVDTINESTPSNGVTVASLNIKSGKLNTNNSVVTANITNAAVTADKLSLGGAQAVVATDETTTSTSYADIATPGPAVTVTIGANGVALVGFSSGIFNVADVKRVSVAVSGATTTAASDTWSIRNDVSAFNGNQGTTYLFTGLTPGSNTFTLKYKTASGTAHFFERKINAIPL